VECFAGSGTTGKASRRFEAIAKTSLEGLEVIDGVTQSTAVDVAEQAATGSKEAKTARDCKIDLRRCDSRVMCHPF